MSEPQETPSTEEKLAIIIRQLWEYYQDWTGLEPNDIETVLNNAYLGTTYPATAEDAEQYEGVDVGDDVFGLTKEAQDLLLKYDD